MCGISGLFAYERSTAQPLDADVGLRMVDALVHRGPDDGGLLVSPRLLLGHRRLSILDLSANAHQPMSDGDGRCWITFNGEIYNFRELRAELEGLGHTFRSRSDTEVILRGYLQWGRDVAPRLEGMFAFAIFDSRESSLWLVRDPIGIKPLFYKDDGQRLWFGSEIKAILADPHVKRSPNWNGLDAFLTFGYTPAPATGFDGISQLEPGESLWVQVGRQTTRSRWSRLPYPDGPTNWSAEECAERLGASIDTAVRRQMVSDVPLGALLSGGLDSSAIVRAMRRTGESQIETFTIGFDDTSFDESPFAARVAKLYGTSHRAQRVTADVSGMLRTLVSHAEEPFADNSMIPFYLLAQQVRRHVVVALSGDGADETLGGYDTYRASQLAPYYRCIPASLRHRLVAPLVHSLPTSTRKYGLSGLLRRFVSAAEQPPLRDHASWRRIVSGDLRNRLYSRRFQDDADGDPIGQYASVRDAPDWLSPLEQQLHIDLRFHLPNDMLVKVDRMSMAHGLEVRVPLLDGDVLRTCLAIPANQKRSGKRGKLPLRHLLKADLPQALIDRKKAGFLSPIETWLRGPWQPMLRDLLNEEFADQTGAFRWPVLRQMLDAQASGRSDHAYPLFALLVLAIWWRTWITGQWMPKPNVTAAAPTKIVRLS